MWAYESHTDLIARELGIDPVEFRRKNILRDGRPQATGTVMKDAAIDEVLDAVAARMNWTAPFDRGSGTLRRGRGVAIGFKASISPTTSVAIVNVSADGSTALYMNTIDMGQGSDTAMAQIVAEVLDIEPEDGAGRASRHRCHALRHGHARLALDRSTWATRCGSPPKMRATSCARSRAEAGLPEGSNYPVGGDFPEALRHAGRQRDRLGSYVPNYTSPDPQTGQSDNVTPFWMVGGTGAEVEVDTETGQVRVTRLVNVADAGTPINPAIAQTQLSGAAIMQLGFTLSENMVFDGGQVTNASFADYKIPGIRDMPPMENELVDAEQETGPFGAKGLGESGTFGVSPAIANAIHDAVGVRLTELPITAEGVLRALRAPQGEPLEDE